MRKLGLMSAMLGIVILSSCEQESAGIAVDFDSELTAESLMEDVDDIADAAFAASINGRVEDDNSEYVSCAIISRDSLTSTITVDFGDGCEGPGGKIRTGKIIMTVSGSRFETGSFKSVSFEDFSIDDTFVQGTRTITNVSNDTDDFLTYSIVMSNGLLIFPDGTSLTRESEIIREWHRGTSPVDDYTAIRGNAGGINRDGLTYGSLITEELIFRKSCGRSSFIPVSGVKESFVGEEEMEIAYGDGACDNLAIVSRDGESSEVEIEYNPRNPRRRFGK